MGRMPRQQTLRAAQRARAAAAAGSSARLPCRRPPALPRSRRPRRPPRPPGAAPEPSSAPARDRLTTRPLWKADREYQSVPLHCWLVMDMRAPEVAPMSYLHRQRQACCLFSVPCRPPAGTPGMPQAPGLSAQHANLPAAAANMLMHLPAIDCHTNDTLAAGREGLRTAAMDLSKALVAHPNSRPPTAGKRKSRDVISQSTGSWPWSPPGGGAPLPRWPPATGSSGAASTSRVCRACIYGTAAGAGCSAACPGQSSSACACGQVADQQCYSAGMRAAPLPTAAAAVSLQSQPSAPPAREAHIWLLLRQRLVVAGRTIAVHAPLGGRARAQ